MGSVILELRQSESGRRPQCGSASVTDLLCQKRISPSSPALASQSPRAGSNASVQTVPAWPPSVWNGSQSARGASDERWIVSSYEAEPRRSTCGWKRTVLTSWVWLSMTARHSKSASGWTAGGGEAGRGKGGERAHVSRLVWLTSERGKGV